MDTVYKVHGVHVSGAENEKLDSSNYRVSPFAQYLDAMPSTKGFNSRCMDTSPRPSEENTNRNATEKPGSNLRHSVTNFLIADGLKRDRALDFGSNVFAGATEDRYTPFPTTTPFRSSSCSPSSDSGRSSLPDLSPSSSMSSLQSMFDQRNLSPSSVSPVSNMLTFLPALPDSRKQVKPFPSPVFSASSPMPSSSTTPPSKSSALSITSPITPEESMSAASPPSSNGKVAKDVDKDGRKQRSKRTNFSASQISQLQKLFEEEQYPDHGMMENIAKDLNMTDKQVKIWFQNKRARYRRRVASSQNNPQGHVIQTPPMYFPMTPIDQSKPGFVTMTSMAPIPTGTPFPGISDKSAPEMRPQQGQWDSYIANVGASSEFHRFAQSWNNPFWPVPMANTRDTQYTTPRQHYGNVMNTPFVPRQTSWCVSPSYLRQGC